MKKTTSQKKEIIQSVIGYLVLAIIMLAMGKYVMENPGIRFKRFLEPTATTLK